jgi:hypothetical protein
MRRITDALGAIGTERTTDMASADILRAARARIEDPKNWTSDWYAKAADGRKIASTDVKATCWCALGAMESTGASERGPEAMLLEEAARSLFSRGIIDVNDEFGHGAVLKVYDAAIAAAEREAGQ